MPTESKIETAKPRIAVFSGPTATISNSPPLVTSNKARAAHGLPLLSGTNGVPLRSDVLRPQRLAAPVIIYVEAFTAHPLESDARELYAEPDGWIDVNGEYHVGQAGPEGTPVYVVELFPEDGLLPLPYMGRQADGSAWEGTGSTPFAPASRTRQTFYPDASRIYEEIDRLGVGGDGQSVLLSAAANFDFYRAIPSGGWTKGRSAEDRTDTGQGEIEPEELGIDFFGYYPFHLQREPTLVHLAHATNMVQRVLATGHYVAAQWLEGSPTNEETMYWLGLLIDTSLPLVGHSAQRPHGNISADGDRNIVDGVEYILSGISLDAEGKDRVGAVMIVDEVVFGAREVAKVDARPGGYTTVGGHGGIVADMGGYGPPELTFVSEKRHTFRSDVRLSLLPSSVKGVTGRTGGVIINVDVPVRDEEGLLPASMPNVTITKYSRYGRVAIGAEDVADPAGEVEILARIEANLADAPLAGFVAEGMSPYGLTDPTSTAALTVALFSGMPVVRVGRGNTGGMASKLDPLFITGNNLSATKARILLMAAMLKLGALPLAADPSHPTSAETESTLAVVAKYQLIFDTH
jgi:L-asparaginase